MIKPGQIRDIIARANPYLQRDPDKLQVFLEDGSIACRGRGGLSFQYRYTLNVIVQDFPYHADRIVLPLLAYLRTAQPELFENHDSAEQVLQFDIELLNASMIDLSVRVTLTERVIVETVDGRLVARHAEEPSHPQYPEEPQRLDIYMRKGGDLVGSIEIPAWRPEIGQFP